MALSVIQERLMMNRGRSRNRGGGERHKEILKMAESLGLDEQLDMLNML